MNKVTKISYFIRCVLGFGNISDGSICWFSNNFYNVHDYKESKGGNGYPDHFHPHYCSKCGKEFKI